MPTLSLRPHPESPSPVTRIEVELTRTASDALRLTYAIFGDLDAVRYPSAFAPARSGGLWKHSCLEAFLEAELGYYEHNLSPSSQWAAYRFDGHRRGMRDAAAADPAIAWSPGEAVARLTATLRLPADLTGRIGLSAIIEDKDGNRSFWALAHPPGAPDFHHAACFAAELPPAD